MRRLSLLVSLVVLMHVSPAYADPGTFFTGDPHPLTEDGDIYLGLGGGGVFQEVPTFNAPYTANGDSTPIVKSDATIPGGGGGLTLGFVAEALGLGSKPRIEAAFGGWTGSSEETDGEGVRATTVVPSIDGTNVAACGGCDGATTVKFDHYELGGVLRLKTDFELGSSWTATPSIGFVGSLARTRYRSDTPFDFGDPDQLPPSYVEERLDTVRLGGEVGVDVGFQVTQRLSIGAGAGAQLLSMDTDFDGHDCASNNQSNTLPCSGSQFATSVHSDDGHFGIRVPVSMTATYDFGWVQLSVRGFGLWDDSMPGVDNPTTSIVVPTGVPASIRYEDRWSYGGSLIASVPFTIR